MDIHTLVSQSWEEFRDRHQVNMGSKSWKENINFDLHVEGHDST